MRTYFNDNGRRSDGALIGLGLCAFGIYNLTMVAEAPMRSWPTGPCGWASQ